MVLQLLCPHSHTVLTPWLSSGPASSGIEELEVPYFTALPGLMQPRDDLLTHTSCNDAKNLTQVPLSDLEEMTNATWA